MLPPNTEGLALPTPRQSSVELDMSSKGERYWHLKCYVDHTDPEDVQRSKDWLEAMDAHLWARYRPGETRPLPLDEALEASIAARSKE